MKELLEYLIGQILGKEDFSIEVKEDETTVFLEAKLKPDDIGLIIGKGGNTIKAIQNILRIRGRIENKLVQVNVTEDLS